MSSAETAASSATGRSAVPAAATTIVPRPGRELAERERNGSGQLVEFCLSDARRHGLERAPIGARDEQAVARGDDALGDGGDLVRRLSRPKNDFRASLSERAVVIDAGEAQVLERGLAQKLKEAVLRGLRREGAGADVGEKRRASSARVMYARVL